MIILRTYYLLSHQNFVKIIHVLGFIFGLILIFSLISSDSFSESNPSTEPVIESFSNSTEISASSQSMVKNNSIKPISELITKNSTKWNQGTASSIDAYVEYDINPQFIIQQTQNQEITTIILENSTYNMKLYPNTLRSHDAWTRVTLENGTTVEIEPLDIKTYKGTISNFDEESSVRLTIFGDWISGFVKRDTETFHIEIMKDVSGEHLPKYMIYKSGDVKITTYSDNFTHSNSTVNASLFDFEKYSLPGFFSQAFAVTTHNAKIILDCDKEFDEMDSTHWTVRQMATINDISDPYEELGIGFEVVGQSCDLSNNDLTGTSATDLLNDLQDRWIDIQTQRHLVHLYTGKVLSDIDLIGLAWPSFPAIDDPRNEGYSLVQHAADSLPPYLATDADKKRLMAHELGHNFGAIHTESGICEDGIFGPCSEFFNTIMCTGNQLLSGACNLLWSTKFQFSDGSLSSSQNSGDTITENAEAYLDDQVPIDCLNRPSVGDWTINMDCTLKSDYSAPADVIVEGNSILVIPDSTTLFVDFSSNNLMIKSGSGVLIKSGGTATSPP